MRKKGGGRDLPPADFRGRGRAGGARQVHGPCGGDTEGVANEPNRQRGGNPTPRARTSSRMRGVKIYTKTGDDGTTGLFGNARVPKDALRVEAYGTVDEANCAIGTALAAGAPTELARVLLDLQARLFDLGADLATPRGARPDPSYLTRIDASHVTALEGLIDRF